jgi:DNA invertase Pin-like site-specific DNA recombinase
VPHGLRSPHVIGYVRVSTTEQGKGWSIGQQEENIRAWGEQAGVRVVEVFRDIGRSGGSVVGRRGLGDALALCAHGGIGGLVVWREDRLGRKVVDLKDITSALHQHGTAVVTLEPFVVSAPHGDIAVEHQRALYQILAENELRTIRGRVIPGVVKAAQAGRRGGRTPLGYRVVAGGVVEVDPAWADVVAGWFRAVAAGSSVSTLVREEAAAGRRRADGSLVTFDTIMWSLRNPFYRGVLAYHPPVPGRGGPPTAPEIRLEGHHPALVDAATWAQVQVRLSAVALRRRQCRSAAVETETTPAVVGAQDAVVPPGGPLTAAPRPVPRKQRSGSGCDDLMAAIRGNGANRPVHSCLSPKIARCGVCGGPVYASLQTRGGVGKRVRVPAYLCHAHKKFGTTVCAATPVEVGPVDVQVWVALRTAIQAGAFAALLQPTLPPDETGLGARLTEIRESLARLEALGAVTGRIPASVGERIAVLRQEEATVLLQTRGAGGQGRIAQGPLTAVLQNPAAWDGLTLTEQREVTARLVRRVAITAPCQVAIDLQGTAEEAVP